MGSGFTRSNATLTCLVALLVGVLAVRAAPLVVDVQPGTGDQNFPDDLKTWDWSNRFGRPFGPGNFGGVIGAASNELSAKRHISAVRITTGSGLDIITFDSALEYHEAKATEWIDVEHAENMIYKYAPDDQDYVRSGEVQPDRLIPDNLGPKSAKHVLTVVKLRPEDRLVQITVYSPAKLPFSLSGVTLHILTKSGLKRDVDVLGGKGYKQNAVTLGKEGCEIIQLKVYHNHQPEALGARYRPVVEDK